MGVVTFGHPESPVVPMLVYSFSKMLAVVERLTARGVAVVGVGFPATPLNMARIRYTPHTAYILFADADTVAGCYTLQVSYKSAGRDRAALTSPFIIFVT